MHYIAYFGSVILTYLPQDSVEKKDGFFAFYPLYKFQTLFSTPFLSCVHT